jgi:hypothetical protein
MRRHIVILAALAALALPALAGAGETVVSFDRLAALTNEGRVKASELINLLVQKGLITPQERSELTHRTKAPAVDGRTLEEIFETEPYRNE